MKSSGGKPRILVVEDSATQAAALAELLERSGFETVIARRAERALEILDVEAVDLVLSDVVMPGMDGPTMVREARKDRPDLKVLFMSGYAEEQLRNSINLENVGFLPKPFSVQELAQATKRALGAK